MSSENVEVEASEEWTIDDVIDAMDEIENDLKNEIIDLKSEIADLKGRLESLEGQMHSYRTPATDDVSVQTLRNLFTYQ